MTSLFARACLSTLALLATPLLKAADDDHEHDRTEAHAHEASHDHDHEGGHEEASRLSEQDMIDFGIRVAEAGPGVIREELRLPGEIRMNENAVAHVGPRFSSVVTAIHRRLGDTVRKGDVLAVMEANETLRPFDLVAPIDGTVVEFHLTLGESVDAGEYAYIIADTSTVWADLSVYQRDLALIRKGQRVSISAGHNFPRVDGEIIYLGPVVSETTRTGLARAVLDNSAGALRPGMFIVGDVVLDEIDVSVAVPLTAIQTMNDTTVVFVVSEDGDGFEPREVVVGHRDSDHAEIRRGLLAGDRYVAEGGFFLKADAQKENFGDGHAH